MGEGGTVHLNKSWISTCHVLRYNHCESYRKTKRRLWSATKSFCSSVPNRSEKRGFITAGKLKTVFSLLLPQVPPLQKNCWLENITPSGHEHCSNYRLFLNSYFLWYVAYQLKELPQYPSSHSVLLCLSQHTSICVPGPWLTCAEQPVLGLVYPKAMVEQWKNMSAVA